VFGDRQWTKSLFARVTLDGSAFFNAERHTRKRVDAPPNTPIPIILRYLCFLLFKSSSLLSVNSCLAIVYDRPGTL
jgi:hypothetical protein